MLTIEITGKVTGKSTIFAKLNDVFPECSFLIQGEPNLYPLFCLRNDYCPRNRNCMEILAKRVKFMFDTFTDAALLFLYFTYQDKPGSHRSGIFYRDMREPRYITFNRTVWEKVKKLGTVYELTLPDSLFLNSYKSVKL